MGITIQIMTKIYCCNDNNKDLDEDANDEENKEEEEEKLIIKSVDSFHTDLFEN